MKKIQKRLLSWLMVMAMVLSVIHISAPMVVQAEDGSTGITFGAPKFDDGRTKYTFPDVTVDIAGGVDKQKIFCISVSDNGSFVANFDGLMDRVDISGVLATGNKYADNSGNAGIEVLTNESILTSITVLGDISDDEIMKFIKNITFYRNEVSSKTEQKVTVVSSAYDVRNDGGVALAIDGKLHIYKYIDWDDDSPIEYKNGTTINVSKSEVYGDASKWNWFNAYSLAKKQRADGLKGYLATITDPVEQSFIYNRFGAIRTSKDIDHEDGAWIGGARTFAAESTDSSERLSAAKDIIFDADEINVLYPADGANGLSGNPALAWRWMCGPESQKEETRKFYSSTDLPSRNKPTNVTEHGYSKWSGTEPNNYDTNKYKQEFCLQYGYSNDGGWNDWGPEHSPVAGNANVLEVTGSGESSQNYMAPAGFLVEFSPYDINQNENDDDGEVPSTPVAKDFTVVTAQPNIVKGELDKTKFSVGNPISVKSVTGDRNGGEELIGTDALEYQWQVYNETNGKWENATGEGNKTKKYTPIASDAGKKIRVHVTAVDNDTLNPEGYLGGVYIDADNSDDLTDKVEGTIVEAPDATVTGNDFLIARDVSKDATDAIVKQYSSASATIDGIVATTVKEVTADEIAILKKLSRNMSMDITLVNGLNSDVTTKVKATIYDNATVPQDIGGKKCQIGSNNFSVPGGTGAPAVIADDILNKGKVTSVEDGTIVGSFTLDKERYQVNESDRTNLNNAVTSNTATTVIVNVTDNKTGLVTPVKVTVVPDTATELASGSLNPFKDDHGEDSSKDPEHYYAGEAIAVDKITLNNGVEYTNISDLTSKFDYKWQYSDGKKYLGEVESDDPSATQKWTVISEAKTNQLTAEQTKAIAGNKVRVIVTPKSESGINNPPVLFIDGDGSSTADTENAKGAGGTFVDLFTIDASDFVVSLDEAKTMTTNQAATASGAVTESVNKNKPDGVPVTATKTSDVASGLNKVTEPSVVPVKFTSDIEVDSNTISAVDKDDTSKLGKQVNAYIKDSAHTETLEDGTKIGIGANNIKVNISTAQQLINANSNAEQAKALSADTNDRAAVVVVDSGVTKKASELSYIAGANPKVTITYDSTNPFKAEVGTYEVTYTYTNSAGKSTSTKATIEVVSEATVDAHDIIISVEEAKKATEDNLKDKSDATGLDEDKKPVGKDKIDINDSDVDKINNVDSPKDIPVTITNTSSEGKLSKKVTAHVVDETGSNNDPDPTKKITIGANNFEITPTQVKKALNGDKALLKELASAIAVDGGSNVDVSDIDVDDKYKTDMKPQPGTYPVTFTYKGVTITVEATVKLPSIDAEDFIISVDDAKTADEKKIVDKANTVALDKAGNPTDKVDVKESDMTAINSVTTPKNIPVEITNNSDEPYPKATVTVHIVDEQKDNKDIYPNNPEKQLSIGANNFLITPEDAEKTDNDALLKNLSSVIALDAGIDVPVDKITVKDKGGLSATPNDYNVTFEYKKGTDSVEVTVVATVKAPTTTPTIDAHDIIISVKDTGKITEDGIKDDSDVSGKTAFDTELKNPEVDVKDEDVDKIKNTDVPDMIPVEIKNTTGDPNPTKTINAFIVDEQKDNKDTQTDPTKQISIGANNFDISVDDAKKAIDGDDVILRQLSSVVAVAGGVNVKTSDIKVADKTQLKAEPGKYPVTFSYTKDGETVEVTVDATVKANSGSKDAKNKDDNNKDNGDGEEITGNDFTVKGGSDPLTPDDIINKGNVDAVDGNGTPIVLPPDSSVKKEDLEKLNDAIKDGKKGTYPVLVSTPNGTQVTVNVTVTDENDNTKPDDTKTDETIAANDFKIGVNDFDKIFGDPTKKDDIVKKLSNAQAYDTDLKTPVEITGIDTTQVKKEPGTYPVTLTTAKGTTTTIKVTVDKDWDTIGDIDKASDSNKTGETVDNDTAKKIVPVAPPAKTGTDGTSEPVKPEDITYEKTNPQDKTEPIDPSKQVPTTGALTINGVPVDSYTISPDGKSLIISKEFLNTLPKGSYPAVLTYADGTKQEFNVNVVDFDETTLVKNPPLFSMYKEIVLKKKNTFTVNLKGISDYAIVTSEITGKGKKAKKVVTIKQQKNGDVLITPKKVGKSQVTCKIVQNGAEYKVVVDLKVLKQYKGTSKNYNLKPKGLVKTSGELPEFNVYKRIVKGKNTKIKFTKVATDAKVKFYVANKKEAKSLKIGKIKRKGKTATCTIKGKKKGWVHLTAEITQNGKTYYTRLLVRIDDGTWSKKQLKKYLK